MPKRWLFRLGCLMVAIAVAAQSGGAGKTRLGKPVRQLDFTEVTRQQWSAWRWERNALVVFRRLVSPGQMSAALYDESGIRLVEANLWSQDVARVETGDATVLGDRRLAVSAALRSASGALAYVIAEIAESGAARVVRTNPFVPLMICGSKDEIWAYGWESAAEKDYKLLRRYSLTRGLQGGWLDRSSLPKDFLFEGRVPGDVALRCNDEEAVLYIGPTHEVIEVKRESGQFDRRVFEGYSAATTVSGVAITESGRLFATFKRQSPGGVLSGLFEFRPSAEGSGSWEPLDETLSATPRRYDLKGADHDQLVLLTSPKPKEVVVFSEVSPRDERLQ